MFKLTNISIAIFIALLLNIFTTYASWQRRRIKGGRYFAIAMLGFTFWTLFAAFDYPATSVPLKIFFAKSGRFYRSIGSTLEISEHRRMGNACVSAKIVFALC